MDFRTSPARWKGRPLNDLKALVNSCIKVATSLAASSEDPTARPSVL